jgi:hypothetical protein
MSTENKSVYKARRPNYYLRSEILMAVSDYDDYLLLLPSGM